MLFSELSTSVTPVVLWLCYCDGLWLFDFCWSVDKNSRLAVVYDFSVLSVSVFGTLGIQTACSSNRPGGAGREIPESKRRLWGG